MTHRHVPPEIQAQILNLRSSLPTSCVCSLEILYLRHSVVFGKINVIPSCKAVFWYGGHQLCEDQAHSPPAVADTLCHPTFAHRMPCPTRVVCVSFRFLNSPRSLGPTLTVPLFGTSSPQPLCLAGSQVPFGCELGVAILRKAFSHPRALSPTTAGLL